MLIKLARGHRDEPPAPDQQPNLLWTAAHGTEEEAEVSHIPASVLPELAPAFVVGQWYSLADAEQLFTGTAERSENDVWTEIPVAVSCQPWEESNFLPIQIRKHRAARMMFDSAVQLAESLQEEGVVWIRVE